MFAQIGPANGERIANDKPDYHVTTLDRVDSLFEGEIRTRLSTASLKFWCTVRSFAPTRDQGETEFTNGLMAEEGVRKVERRPA
jgi:hypothetical protein